MGFVGNLLLFAAVKEFCKSIKNWQSYSYGEGGTLFLTHGVGHIGDGFLRVKWPNQQCQSTEGSSSPKDRLQSHQVHLTMLQYYTYIHAIYSDTYTKMNLSTVKWAQWDKTQSRELLGLFMCVCIALCTIVAHNIAQNRSDNFPSYPPDNHHCSDDVYLREGEWSCRICHAMHMRCLVKITYSLLLSDDNEHDKTLL